MNPKVLSILWFIGGAIVGIGAAYGLGQNTVFAPPQPVLIAPTTSVQNTQYIADLKPGDEIPYTPGGEIIIATSSAPTLPDIGERDFNTAYSLNTNTSTDNITPEIASLFADSPFRVITVADPHPDGMYSVIVASTRNSDPNHDICGSLYSKSHACYFFLEPISYANLSEKTVYLGSLDRAGSLSAESLRFTSTSTMEFMTGEGDAGWSVERLWELNLTKKTITLKKEITRKYDELTEEVTTITSP